jgi:predicted small secreted protein
VSRFMPIAILAAAALSGCATTNGAGPVDVTRYHLGNPVGRGSVAVEPVNTNGVASFGYQVFADAVAGELAGIGFSPTAAGTPSDYIAAVSFTRTSRGFVRKRPPVTIGIGGGTGGYSGVGVGGGAEFGIGGGKAEVIATELTVQLRRRSDNSVQWEGRAVTESLSGPKGEQQAVTAQRLAKALFKGFPGESGITITVK